MWLITQHTLELDAKGCRASLGSQDPGPQLPGRVMSHVLAMSALEFGHPVAFLVQMEPDDCSLHGSGVAPARKCTRERMMAVGEVVMTGRTSCVDSSPARDCYVQRVHGSRRIVSPNAKRPDVEP